MSDSPKLDYPALYVAADKAAQQHETRFYLALGIELLALVVAAGVGEMPRSALGDAGPIVAFGLFIGALILRISGVAVTAERRWYDARAAAETLKSASWEFATCGTAFPKGTANPHGSFADLCGEVLGSLPHLRIPTLPDGDLVTRMMQVTRARTIADRSDLYKRARVDEQVQWYGEKAKSNAESAQRLRWALVTLEALACLLGLLRTLGFFDVNWLGVIAAGAAGLTAWQQAKKYDALAESYSVTSHEVKIVASTLADARREVDWARAVHDAEAAFSREHTMWLARRQSRSPGV